MSVDDLPDTLVAGDIRFRSFDGGAMNVCHIQLPAGADAAPLLEGLPQNLCQCPHWGMVLKGAINVRYADGQVEKVAAGELYYWPPGHSVSVDEDYAAVEFSPKDEMRTVLDHVRGKLGG